MLSTLLSEPLGVIVLILLLVVIGLAVWLYRIHSRMKSFLISMDAQNVADSLSLVSTDLKDLQKFRGEIEVYLGDVERRLKKSVQSVHTVRFNPFQGTGDGGKQSFATAFLSEDGDGVIVSTLYARDHVSVFGKPVVKYASTHELSDEEAEALEQARVNLK